MLRGRIRAFAVVFSFGLAIGISLTFLTIWLGLVRVQQVKKPLVYYQATNFVSETPNPQVVASTEDVVPSTDRKVRKIIKLQKNVTTHVQGEEASLKIIPTNSFSEYLFTTPVYEPQTKPTSTTIDRGVSSARNEFENLCPNACSGKGVCNFQLKECRCAAGWSGVDCSETDGRECNANVNQKSASLCDGHCHLPTGLCYCNGSYPERPLSFHCQSLLTLPQSVRDLHEHRLWPTLFSPQGWCEKPPDEKPSPEIYCPCIYDGTTDESQYCSVRTKQFCLNDCSGRGACDMGACVCPPGYFDVDCSQHIRSISGNNTIGSSGSSSNNNNSSQNVRRGNGGDQQPLPSQLSSSHQDQQHQLFSSTPLAPRVYVYDMPVQFTTRLLQFRADKQECVHRMFDRFNNTEFTYRGYPSETALHEGFLAHPLRTHNPEEADFFYVPVYVACYIYPVWRYAPTPDYAPDCPMRVLSAHRMLVQAAKWVESQPWWRRGGGKDHIFLLPHDEGACWVPLSIRPAVLLTHYGYTGQEQESAYGHDNWKFNCTGPEFPRGTSHDIGTQACFDPQKDIVVPQFKADPLTHNSAPDCLHAMKTRTTLAFFSGRIIGGEAGFEDVRYSRGVRKKMHQLFAHRPGFIIREGKHHSYSQDLCSSVFGLAPLGSGHSPRVLDSVMHGAIPVIIQDGVLQEFEGFLNYSEFSVRIPESEVPELENILRSIPEDRVKEMQAALKRVRERFLYRGVMRTGLEFGRSTKRDNGGVDSSSVRQKHAEEYITKLSVKESSEIDALDTIFQILAKKLEIKQIQNSNNEHQ